MRFRRTGGLVVRYDDSHRSDDVEYRGRSSRGLPFPTSRGGRTAAGVGGLGGIGLIIVLVVSLLGGGDAASILEQIGGLDGLENPGAPVGDPPPRNEFIEFVFDDVQDTWVEIFDNSDQSYPRARLVVFEQSVTTGGCGSATAAVGPFYCPADQHAYLDQEFFDELASPRWGAPGDFAQAYVIAHELGHHVQNVLGITASVREQQQSDPARRNDLSVRMELQADCLAGVWGWSAKQRGLLEAGDLEEGLAAAEAVGDDRIQEQATGTTNPETWTHGSSEQRRQWFLTGFDSGNPDRCNTFSSG